jgi:hypothetical protein
MFPALRRWRSTNRCLDSDGGVSGGIVDASEVVSRVGAWGEFRDNSLGRAPAKCRIFALGVWANGRRPVFRRLRACTQIGENKKMMSGEIMKAFLRSRLVPVVLWCSLAGVSGAEEVRPPPRDLDVPALNDSAAFLAGVKLPHAGDHPLLATAAWQRHAKVLDRDFANHRKRVLVPKSEWAAAEIPPALAEADVVRYLFSGPDFLHVFHAFPDAETYILCGLEPVGEFPDLSRVNDANATKALMGVENALSAIINLSFFRTKDMKVDLVEAMFAGTTPVIAVFLARSGQYLHDLEFYRLAGDGTLGSQGANAKGANVVRIAFSAPQEGKNKTLYYFSSDLSDSGFDKSGFRVWLENQPKGNSYLKAASYLMHGSWFSKVRGHLLDHSLQMVMDDSGIPFRFFDRQAWDSHLYGVYTGPIDLFKEYDQSDLRAAYAEGRKPLAFGTGYKWRNGQSNLMRFVRRDLAN